MNLTHSGAVGFLPYYDVAVVSLTAEDQLQLERFYDQGRPLRMKINVQNRFTNAPVETANVVGEIPGTEHPEQVVVVGGHLDSMDFAPGTTDDGVGVATTLGSAEAILASGYKPRRTIRFVLFMGEEEGLLGSLAYTKTHKDEIANHVAALILDNGQGAVTGFNLGGRDDLVEPVKKFADSAKAFGPLFVDTSMSFGTDAGPFILAGVPGINMSQSSPEYRYTHHTVVDTLDKVRPEMLIRDTTIMALTAFWIADTPERLASPWPPEKTAKALVDQRMDSFLKAAGLWTFGELGKTEKPQ
jgi:Zn-dependent M28 family amino/carboxypeptidase